MDGGGINAGSAPQPHTITLQLLPNRDQTGFALSQSVRPRVPQMTVALRRQKAPSYPHGPIEAYNCGGTPRLMMSLPIWVRSIVSKRVCSGRARIALVSPMTAGYVVGHDQLGCYVQTKMSSRSRLGRFRNNCPLFPPGDLNVAQHVWNIDFLGRPPAYCSRSASSGRPVRIPRPSAHLDLCPHISNT